MTRTFTPSLVVLTALAGSLLDTHDASARADRGRRQTEWVYASAVQAPCRPCIIRATGDACGLRSTAMSDNLTSVSLLERLRDRSDEDAWHRFHDLYGPLIRGWLIRRGVRQQDADDVGQDVMSLAVTELPGFQHNGRVGALRAWLRQVVANRLKSFWRQQNRQATPGGSDYGDLAEQLADPQSQLSRVWNEEYHRVLCERLLELAASEFQEQTMEAFRRVALDGQKASEAAEALGMSANAVRIAQSRVLRRLRELGEGLLD